MGLILQNLGGRGPSFLGFCGGRGCLRDRSLPVGTQLLLGRGGWFQKEAGREVSATNATVSRQIQQCLLRVQKNNEGENEDVMGKRGGVALASPVSVAPEAASEKVSRYTGGVAATDAGVALHCATMASSLCMRVYRDCIQNN